MTRLPHTTLVLSVGVMLALRPHSLLAESGTAALTGTLLDKTGARIASGIVILQPMSGEGSKQTRSNQVGSFRFDGLSAGSYFLRMGSRFDRVNIKLDIGAREQRSLRPIVLEPNIRANAPWDANPEWTRVLPLDQTFGGVAGTVRNGKAPLAGVIVELSGQMAATDSSGKFEIDSVPPGRQSVDVIQAGFLPLNLSLNITGGFVSSYAINLIPCPNKGCVN
jgi:hypothetical protein